MQSTWDLFYKIKNSISMLLKWYLNTYQGQKMNSFQTLFTCYLFLYWALSKCCDSLWRNISCFHDWRARTCHQQNKANLLHWKLAQKIPSIHPKKKAPWKFSISLHLGFIKKRGMRWKNRERKEKKCTKESPK